MSKIIRLDELEKYKLELRWSKAAYEQEGICKFDNAYFCGPALSEAIQLNNNDHIMIDFYVQYYVIVENVYVAKFSWGEVVYNPDNTITLKDAMLTHNTELNKVPKLNNSDYLVIDTQNHEDEKHLYNLMYKSYVVKETTNIYDFTVK